MVGAPGTLEAGLLRERERPNEGGLQYGCSNIREAREESEIDYEATTVTSQSIPSAVSLWRPPIRRRRGVAMVALPARVIRLR